MNSKIILSVAIVAVMAIVSIVYYSILDQKKNISHSQNEASTIKLIKNKTPTATSDAKIFDHLDRKVAKFEQTPKRIPVKTYRDKNGVLRYEGGARVPSPNDFKNSTIIENNSVVPKFRHPVENEIASLLTCRPGGIVAGIIRYDGYEQDFVNSLVDKIEITDKDTLRQKQIKQAVIETKKELAERVKDGENIVTILKETREELRRMADYKHELETLTREQLKNPDVTDEDIKLVYEAANKMLEEKGIAPIRVNTLLRQRALLLNKTSPRQ